MDTTEIEERVLEIIQDASFEGRILPFINKCLREIAGTQNLDMLDSTDQITASELINNIPLPDDYLHTVYRIEDEDGRTIGIPAHYNNYARFKRYNSRALRKGRINDAAVRGRNLYYADMEDRELTISYFSIPRELVDGDIPLIIPEFLHESIIVNYIAFQLFNIIEDGVADAKTNTKIYASLYAGGLADLQMFTVVVDQPEYIQDEIGY